MQKEQDHLPFPKIADVTSYFHKAKVFSTLYLLKGYYQVPLNPEDIFKTSITTLFGVYTFNFSALIYKNTSIIYASCSTYCHHFLLAITANLVSLYATLKGKPEDLKWCPRQEVALHNAKNAL
ncbi:uncharacterized protein [Palaemon carinicauda]|uniref:uncharacterized protein n=1 Tax=Palaemon carinicauda TaxID=392227 RepID=UPI0035B5E8A8